MGMRDIDLYDLTLFGGLSGFGNIMISSTIQISRTYLKWKAVLMRYVSITTPFLGSYLKDLLLITSNPGAFFWFILVLIALTISFGVTNSIYSKM